MTHKRPGRRARTERQQSAARRRDAASKLLDKIFHKISEDQRTDGGTEDGEGKGGTKADHKKRDTEAD